MDIFKNEFCKLFAKRIVWILLLLIVINPLLLLYIMNTPNEDGYSLRDYSRLYHEIQSYSRDDILTELEKGAEGAETFGEMTLYGRVSGEVKAIFAYDEYLESIDEKSADIALMNRIGSVDRYAVRNAEKTKKVYQKLKGTKPVAEDPMGILNITDSDITDYIAVLMIFVIAVVVVFSEKNDNRIFLLRTAKKGRKPLMMSKVMVMLVSVLGITLFLYGANFFVSRIFYGLGDLERPIQSLYLYRNSPFDLSAGEFLAGWFLVKVLSYILLGVLFLFLCAVFDQIVFVFMSAAALVLFEIICYTKIPLTHFLACFKYVNIMFGIKTGDMFSDYVNLNLFGYPVNTLFLYGIMWVILLCVFTIGVVTYLDSPHENKAGLLYRFHFLKGSGQHTSLFFHECYKMLIPGRCLFVLILSCLFVIWWNPALKMQFESMDEVYYKEYMDKFYGPLNAETYQMAEEEKRNYEKVFRHISTILEQGKSEEYINIKYKKELNRKDAFEKAMAHLEYLESLKSGWCFYDKGYAILTDTDYTENRDISQAFLYVIMLIALTVGIYGMDYNHAEMRLLRTTYSGRRKLKNIKGLLGIFCTVLSFILVYLVRLFHVLRAYGVCGLHAPAASMEHLSKIPQNLSVLQYLFVIMGMRLIGGLMITGIVFMLSRLLKNSVSVIALGIMIFMIPLVLVALGVPNAQYFLWNPLLIGNVF